MTSREKTSTGAISDRIRLLIGDRAPAVVAREIGIPGATLGSILSGTIPRADTALKIARGLGCNVAWLLSGEGSPANPAAMPRAMGERPQVFYGQELQHPSEDAIGAQGNRYRHALATLQGAIEQSGISPNEGLRQVLLSLLFRHDISIEDLAQLLYTASPPAVG